MSDSENILHPEFMAFVTDEDSNATLRAWAKQQGWPEACVQSGGPDMLASLLAQQATPPKLVLVDFDGQEDQPAAAARLVNLCGPKAQVIGTGSVNDVRMYRAFIQTGLVDYMVKPLAPDTLSQVVQLAQKPRASASAAPKEARLVFVIGSRGGVGASTCAVNMAWILAKEQGFNTALVDLDLQFGTAALSLDIEPGRGARDIMSSPSRVDSLMIASSMIIAEDKLSVLSAEENLEDPVPVDPGALNAILKEVRENFDYVIVDLPRSLVSSQRRILGLAHAILLISDQSLFGIRDCLRLKMLSQSATAATAPLIVTARHGKDRPPQVDKATFEKGIQDKISFVIPEDSKVANDAANSGRALASITPQAPSAQAIRAIAEHITGMKKQETGKSGFMSKLLGGKDK
ncbi:MAG: AAA family ATPase [Alphaproteobacteria bacterium]|nr:AAA family ATPase [Alphaproteobacteria bacterium]